jgi:diguanylate cyclase (GGDEF)-like protein/PAS domain S-box-containing protein
MKDEVNKKLFMPSSAVDAISEDQGDAGQSRHAGFNESTCEFAMNAAEIGMWDLGLRSNRVLICGNLAKLLGLGEKPLEICGQTWSKVIHGDDLRRIEKVVASTCETNTAFDVEFRVKSKHHELIWLHSRGRLRKDADGNCIRIIGVALDVTEKKLAEKALQESDTRFRLLADASPDGIFVRLGEKYVYANRAATKMMGLEDPSRLKDVKVSDFIERKALQAIEENLEKQLAHHVNTIPITIKCRRLDGSEVFAEVTYGRILWNGEEALQILSRDVTEQKRTEHKLQVLNERLKLAVEGTGEGIWDRDLVTGRYELSGSVKDILGYSDSEMPRLAKDWAALIHPDDRPRVSHTFEACANGEAPAYRAEYRVRARDRSWKWVSSRGVVVSRDDDGKPTAMTGTITDITKKRESEETVWRHANLDPLTGLPNRRHFIDNLETEMRRTPRSGAMTGLLFIDLDGFKQVNDLYGHEAGDLLLMEASYRIKLAIRESDYLARLGGDEFTVLLMDLRDAGRIEFVCQDILARLSKPFSIRNEYAYISASIGVALAPIDATTADELLRKADTAMYGAKAAGKNQFSYFAQAMDDRAHMRLRVSAELRGAISTGQLSLRYQPVIDLHDGRVCKTEALLRWEHPTLGKIDPAFFIPIAEEAGLMADIGNWVFREAVDRTKQWSEYLGMPFKVALNKSPVQFNRRYMESHWLDYLRELDLPPSSIVVEITEGLLLHASDEVNAKLLEYRDAGIQVAIDDFGTGYSSMAYLREFDIDYLKIDQSFVRGIPHNPGHCTIAETIIVMAHKLGQQVIAEGIETKEQADFLIQAGCDYGQGYYFSPPLTDDKVKGILNRRYL